MEKLLLREAREEAGIEIDISQGLRYVNSVAFIRPDGIPVVLVKFAAPAEEVKKYDCILGIKEEVEKVITLLQ